MRRKMILFSMLAVMLASVTGCASTNGSGDAPPPDVAVNISGFAFDPGVTTIAAGTTVVWTNADSAPHTVTADDGSWDSGDITTNGTYSMTFDEPGTYLYHCNFHPNMTGTIEVTE